MNNEVLTLKKSPKNLSKSKQNDEGHHRVEHYKLLDGEVTILRTNRSGNFWQMSCWIRQEGKCFRKSLRTKNKEEAINLAREEYFKLQGNIRAGNKIYSITARELVDEFVKYKAEQAKTGFITEGRVITIKISLNRWFLNFVGENKKLDKISRNDFEGYYVWRRQKASDVAAYQKILEALHHSKKFLDYHYDAELLKKETDEKNEHVTALRKKGQRLMKKYQKLLI